MIRHIPLAAFALVVATAPALAGEYKGPGTLSWVYAPLVLEVLPNQYNTIGQTKGVITHPGEAAPELQGLAIVCNSYDRVDGSGAGTCLAYDLSGDHYVVDYECSVPLAETPPGAIAVCEGHDKIRGGTGKFANMKGSATFTQYITGVLPDGTYVGYSLGNQDFTW